MMIAWPLAGCEAGHEGALDGLVHASCPASARAAFRTRATLVTLSTRRQTLT